MAVQKWPEYSWGFYAASVIKDTLFTALFALYCCKTMDLFQKCCDKNDGNAGIADWMIYGLLNFLICAIRSEGICRVIPVCVLMCLAMRRGRRKMAVTALAVICVFAVYNMVVLPWMGIGKAPGRDMASIPFQQTARYLRDYGWDIRPEEQEVLDRVFPEVSIAEQYQEELSDPVKNYAYAFGKEEILDYIRVWAAMGIRHPDVYIQATMNNAYGYFYPFHNTRVMAAYQNYIKEGLADLDIHYVMNKETRDALTDYAELWRVFPGVSILSNPGTAGIVILVIWMLLVRKRFFREMAVLSVAALHLMVCVASPVNGFLRYAMPLMAALPVLIAWCWMRYKKTGVSLQFEQDIIY
ncbi:MAG: DUF6020 family protein [Clostridiales bacterium]|nr:DUF6020 family protein [Clostridiales bacterium]